MGIRRIPVTLLFSDRYEAVPGNIEMTNGNVDT